MRRSGLGVRILFTAQGRRVHDSLCVCIKGLPAVQGGFDTCRPAPLGDGVQEMKSVFRTSVSMNTTPSHLSVCSSIHHGERSGRLRMELSAVSHGSCSSGGRKQGSHDENNKQEKLIYHRIIIQRRQRSFISSNYLTAA